jgi:hypothetical protein
MNRTGATLLLSGLALGVMLSAQAAEPQSDATAITYSSIKVAVDAKTGKLRPLTQAENKALDIAEAKAARDRAARAPAGSRQPATMKEAVAARHVLANGADAVRVPDSMLQELQVSRDADGTLHFSEGQDGAATQEALK